MSYKVMILVPINNDSLNPGILEAVQPVVPPDFQVDITNIDGGMPYIESRYDLAQNAPYVIQLAQDVEKKGYDGIFVSDMDMCGVEPSREVLKIPIIGGFRASAYSAMMLSQRFSIITILESVVDLQRNHVRDFGITQNFASIRTVDMPVSQLSNTAIAVSHVYEESIKAIEDDGADSIMLGCTGFTNVAHTVHEMLVADGKPVPVIDPNQAALSYLVLLVRNQLTQSRLTYLPPPQLVSGKVEGGG
jgi:Asp/Glu/hydantoin racemase